jgi:hypothetical protein
MKGLLIIGLWALAGSGVGASVTLVTDLAVTFPVTVAFVILGIYLSVRTLRSQAAANVSLGPPAVDPSERVAD